MTELDAEPAQRPLAKIRRAYTILRALKEILAAAEAMEEEFWSDLDNGLDESYTEILLGLRKENDPEAAIIFSLRWQGWEICNDQELLLEEIAALRRTMSLGEAERRASVRDAVANPPNPPKKNGSPQRRLPAGRGQILAASPAISGGGPSPEGRGRDRGRRAGPAEGVLGLLGHEPRGALPGDHARAPGVGGRGGRGDLRPPLRGLGRLRRGWRPGAAPGRDRAAALHAGPLRGRSHGDGPSYQREP